jgi:hypothetical protein
VSHTYKLVITTGAALPASYPLTLTATWTGYTSLTATIPITIATAPVEPAADQVRSIIELLTVIWRDGQPPRSLTSQDVRDTILSLALQTSDFTRLPTTTSGLPTGRAYVDPISGVVKVNI